MSALLMDPFKNEFVLSCLLKLFNHAVDGEGLGNTVDEPELESDYTSCVIIGTLLNISESQVSIFKHLSLC